MKPGQACMGMVSHVTETSMIDLLENAVNEFPQRLCIQQGDRSYSYKEIHDRADRLAVYLRDHGVGPGTVVCIYLERSPELILSMIAIMKSGAAYLPLSPQIPPERLAHMLNECSPALILTTSPLASSLRTSEAVSSSRFLALDEEWALIEESPEGLPFAPVPPEALAYIIFTSGSTGKPKGVLIRHMGLANLVLEQISTFRLEPEDRVLQYASAVFDASVSEIFTTLVAGAALILLPGEGLYAGEELMRILRDEQISVVTLTPSVLATLPQEALPALKTVISAGEACTLKLMKYWAAKCRFINAYGPTEVTVCAAMHVCSVDDSIVILGNPLAHTALYLLDEQLVPIPQGQEGELFISGLGLAAGYLNAPAETGESFILNPFSDGFGDRLYRTGDLCRMDAEGRLEWLSRVDHQIKISGIRIELGELEYALREHPDIEEAVVQYHAENNLIQAYMKSTASAHPNISQIRNYLLGLFPMYMLPSRFRFLQEFPSLASGKIDRSSLPPIEDVRPNLAVPYAPPRTRLETALSEMWSELLRLDTVGIHDNFFELGGQSLMGVQIVSRIRTILQMEIPLHVIFNAEPTIERTAEAIERYQLEQLDESELERLLEEMELLDAAASISLAEENQ